MTCRESAPWPSGQDADTALDWLQRCDGRWLALHNRLHRHRNPWQGQWAGQSITVQWCSSAPVAEAQRDVHLTLGNAALLLQLPVALLTRLDLAHVEAHDLNSLSRAILLELALLGLIEPLERLSGQTLRVVAAPEVAEREPFVAHLNLQLTLADAEPVCVPLHLSQDAAQVLADLLDEHLPPATQSLENLAWRWRVESGEALLSVAELRSLRLGDVVMLDDWPEGQIRLVLNDRLQARAVLDGNTATLLEHPVARPFAKEHCMTDSAVGACVESSLDDLPLTLVCQVGSVELTLAQLREMGAGSLLQLTPQLHDGVDLMVNGRRIGQGQLVKMGEGLGVRLLSLVAP